MLWLALPQTQGAKYLYVTYIHPSLLAHETDIEEFITKAHEHAKAAGVTYIKKLLIFARDLILGDLRKEVTTPQPSPPIPPQVSYTQYLLSRFRFSPIAETHGFVANLFPGISNGLVPNDLTTRRDRQQYITTQRKNLKQALEALDEVEQRESSSESGSSLQDMVRDVLSESEFERIPREVPEGPFESTSAKGSWWPSWKSAAKEDDPAVPHQD